MGGSVQVLGVGAVALAPLWPVLPRAGAMVSHLWRYPLLNENPKRTFLHPKKNAQDQQFSHLSYCNVL